jgi:hypothetical protein
MKIGVATCVAASILCASNLAEASQVKLPTDVRPLTQQETANLYSGKTINYPGFSYYFGPDGYLVGVTRDGRSFGRGTWAVDDNTICVRSIWQSKLTSRSFRFHTCYTWYANDAAYWTKITKGRFSGSVYKGDPSVVVEGDNVSELAAKVKRARRYIPRTVGSSDHRYIWRVSIWPVHGFNGYL